MNESFDKWLNTISETVVLSTTEYERLKMAYTAGLLRAAEICKSKHENMDSRLNYVAGWLDAEAAIRKEAGE